MFEVPPSNKTNWVWQETVEQVLTSYDYEVGPRGMHTREISPGSYTVEMPAYLDLVDRKINIPFMFAEAAWIISGSNRLSDLTPYMKVYENFSDDGKFLKGAYGPKVVEQLPYIVETLMADEDSRQANMSIWRERPARSKDVPCTTGMQFLIRDGKLNLVTTMRSNDVILGFTYDVFSFSMVAKAVQLLLKEQGKEVELGNLTVNAGSLHMYERHFEEAKEWIDSMDRVPGLGKYVVQVVESADTYEELIDNLKNAAHEMKFYPERMSNV